MADRATQIVTELLVSRAAESRATQLVAELILVPPTPTRTTQLVAELLYSHIRWVDIPNFVELELPKTAFPGGHCRVNVYLWTDTPGAMIKARLQNVSDGTTVGTSPEVIATTPTYAGFFAVLEGSETAPAGTAIDMKYYRLQVTTNTREAALFAQGAGLLY